MTEIAFATEAEAIAYAKANGVATEYTAKGQLPDGTVYDYTEENIEHRGTAYVVRDDTRKADGSRGDVTALQSGPTSPVIPTPVVANPLTPLEQQIRDNLARDPHFYDAPVTGIDPSGA